MIYQPEYGVRVIVDYHHASDHHMYILFGYKYISDRWVFLEDGGNRWLILSVGYGLYMVRGDLVEGDLS